MIFCRLAVDDGAVVASGFVGVGLLRQEYTMVVEMCVGCYGCAGVMWLAVARGEASSYIDPLRQRV